MADNTYLNPAINDKGDLIRSLDDGGVKTQVVAMHQTVSAANTKTITAAIAQPLNPWQGDWEETRDIGIVRLLIVLAATDTSVSGTFIFEFGEDGVTANISESRVIDDFTTVRDFDLINAGKYFRCSFEPDVGLGSESVFLTTTLRRQNDGSFVRLANQQIEEGNAAMGQTFAYLKAFLASTGKSINVRANPTGQLDVGDFLTEIAKGNITSHSRFRKFGANSSLGASDTYVAEAGGAAPYHPTSGTAIQAFSASAADTATGGTATGAHQIIVEGLNTSWALTTSTLALAGTSTTDPSSQNYIRVSRVYVSQVGTYRGANVGDITVRPVGAAGTYGVVSAGLGQTQLSGYTVPAATTLYVSQISYDVDSTKSVTLRLWQAHAGRL